MGIYKLIVESEKAEILKAPFKEPIHKLEEAIKVYNDSDDDEDKSDLLGVILKYLEEINNIMNAAGITYVPATPEDESEEVFKSILSKHIDVANSFIKSGVVTDFESFNVQNRYITALVDVHRTQYVKERRDTYGPGNLT